jgi:uroporphyrinogen III methyltransferase/synthase
MKPGLVYITGAGPGDAGLITVRGLETIKQAQVLVYDRLAGEGLVDQATAGCEKIYVGKESNNHTMTQDQINQVLYEKALEGKIVTRLKGGDPYVFGRGGEEALFLEERGISFEVIPGITSGIGGLAYSGIPITHRDVASSFHIITGHLKDEDRDLDWESLAKLKGTLVFYMGMAQLETITSRLMAFGMDNTTPAALIQWATTTRQRSVEGTLESLVDKAKASGIGSPVLIVIGQVVALRNRLNFYEQKPLRHKKVLVTRARAQSSRFSQDIRNQGGEAVEFPMIRIVKRIQEPALLQALKELDRFDWLVFTSQNAVEVFFEALFYSGGDVRRLGQVKIAVVGNATAKALEIYHLHPDLVPETFVAESLWSELEPLLTREDKVLLLQGDQARPFLRAKLDQYAHVTPVTVYDTVRETEWSGGTVGDLLKEKTTDAITFTSSSTVHYLMEALGGDRQLLKGIPLISIGPVTTQSLEEYGLVPTVEAAPHNMEGLMAALLEGVKNV